MRALQAQVPHQAGVSQLLPGEDPHSCLSLTCLIPQVLSPSVLSPLGNFPSCSLLLAGEETSARPLMV